MSARESVRSFTLDDIPFTPWKNGGGRTREIVVQREDPRAIDFDWRLSVASIECSGPFSRFDGVDRVIALLEGKGVDLVDEHGTSLCLLDRPFESFAFPGEARIDGRLVDGPTTDLNLMVRRSHGRPWMRVARTHCRIDLREPGALLVLRGRWCFGGTDSANGHAGKVDGRAWKLDGRAWTLDAGQGLWWPGATATGDLGADEEMPTLDVLVDAQPALVIVAGVTRHGSAAREGDMTRHRSAQ